MYSTRATKCSLTLLEIELYLICFMFFLDSSEPKLNAQRPPGKKTKWLAEHIHERVLAIALIPPTEGRVVSLWLRGKQRELRFSEVEVYNGALLGKLFP